MIELKLCPFCGVPMNHINGMLFAFHKDDCFFQYLDEHEVDLSEDDLDWYAKTIEEALETNYNTLKTIKTEHDNSHNEYEENYNKYRPSKIFRY